MTSSTNETAQELRELERERRIAECRECNEQFWENVHRTLGDDIPRRPGHIGDPPPSDSTEELYRAYLWLKANKEEFLVDWSFAIEENFYFVRRKGGVVQYCADCDGIVISYWQPDECECKRP